MSDFAQVVIDLDVGQEDAAALGERIRKWLVEAQVIEPEMTDSALSGAAHRPGPNAGSVLSRNDDVFTGLSTNGLHISVGRKVHDSGANGIELHCQACGREFAPGNSYHYEVESWFRGNDHATFACPNCGAAKLLAEWRGPCPWGFGNLAFEFWNWPRLSEQFLAAIGRQLGHRTNFVWRQV